MDTGYCCIKPVFSILKNITCSLPACLSLCVQIVYTFYLLPITTLTVSSSYIYPEKKQLFLRRSYIFCRVMYV